jgi:hypothetical protein
VQARPSRLRTLIYHPQWLAILIASIGCHRAPQQTYPVQGTLRWRDGAPAVELVNATVELQVIDGPTIRVSPRGAVQADGTFVLKTYAPNDGAPPGHYRAIVMPQLVIDEEMRPPVLIDSHWHSFESSPLRATIEPKPNVVEFILDRVGASQTFRYETSGLQVTVEPKPNQFTIQVARP